MPEYRVTWEIDVEADTPEEAARQAQTYQRDPEAIVGVFDVQTRNPRHANGRPFGDRERVDLDAIDGKVTE